MENLKNDVLISVEGVSKKFCRSLKKSLWYGLKDIFSEVTGSKRKEELRTGEFWAVKNVSFELRRGQCLGLIGHNGAGKSTLLKMLNGLVKPDQGRIEMNGKVGALIELGAGFNPILTGKENVYNNAAVLGFTKAEIDAKYDDIVAFAELADFMDTPVRSYSSGMKVRLGFAVAAQMEPDVLIIDEVLAVGDIGFRLKCFNKIDEIAKKCAVVFVSHQMQQISRLCDQVLLMSSGTTDYLSKDVSGGLDKYLGGFREEDSVSFLMNGDFEIKELSVGDDYGDFKHGDDMEINFCFRLSAPCQEVVVSFTILDFEQKPLALVRPVDPLVPTKSSENCFILEGKILVKELMLSQGIYKLSIHLKDRISGKNLVKSQAVRTFQVISDKNITAPFDLNATWLVS